VTATLLVASLADFFVDSHRKKEAVAVKQTPSYGLQPFLLLLISSTLFIGDTDTAIPWLAFNDTRPKLLARTNSRTGVIGVVEWTLGEQRTRVLRAASPFTAIDVSESPSHHTMFRITPFWEDFGSIMLARQLLRHIDSISKITQSNP